MLVGVNHAACQGHARCAAVAPELFELDDNGYIATRTREVPASHEDLARKGARVCPEKVISIHE